MKARRKGKHGWRTKSTHTTNEEASNPEARTPREEAAPESCHGLNILKERAEGLGGRLTIATVPGQGTEVRVSLPFEQVRL